MLRRREGVTVGSGLAIGHEGGRRLIVKRNMGIAFWV